MNDSERLSKALCDYVTVQGDTPIKDKTLTYRVDEQWWFAVTGADSATVTDPEGMPIFLEPGTFFIKYDGWPAGTLNIHGEGQFAAGDAANIDTFIKALKRSERR